MNLRLSASQNVEQALLQERVRALVHSAPMGLTTALVSILVLAVTLADNVDAAYVWLWWLIATSVVVLRAVQILRIDRASEDVAYLSAQWRGATHMMYLSSLGWALSLSFAALIAKGLELPLVAAVGTGVFISALLMYRSIPKAAQMHILMLSVAFMVTAWMLAGWSSLVFGLMVLVYGFSLSRSITLQDRNFVDSIVHSIERQESDQTVRLLLNDYESHSSDWLWTAMPDGTLRDVSARFGEAAGRDPKELEGSKLVDLFGNDGDNGARERLAFCLKKGQPIRDHVLPIEVRGEQRFWDISAHPREDGRISGVARDVTETKQAEDRVNHMAHFDGLTGLANRYLFNDRLGAFLERGDNPNTQSTLFYIDLDDFKSVNDTQGHLTGDQLLCEVGRRLADEVRENDLVARLGGDEFAVLLESTSSGSAGIMERAHRFLTVLREPYVIGDHVFRISASIGVARCPRPPCDALEMLRQADLALYAAKAKGRDSFALFEPSLDKAARHRQETESDLREAMERGDLQLHYQPIIDLSTGSATGYEALIRWAHRQRGMLLPGDFMTIAEQTGLIVPLGEWVIHQALMETASWPDHLRVAINLSPTQVGSPRLVQAVAESLALSGIAAERVDFEITEHVVLEGSDANRATLYKLRELGARISLDDFGTGYSSLNYLRNFPFDRIKIDRAFVTGLMGSEGDQAIVRTICNLAQALNMATVAEGVENIAQLDLLRDIGCDEAQGYAIGRPVPAQGSVVVQSLDSPARIEESAAPPLSEAAAAYSDGRRAIA